MSTTVQNLSHIALSSYTRIVAGQDTGSDGYLRLSDITGLFPDVSDFLTQSEIEALLPDISGFLTQAEIEALPGFGGSGGGGLYVGEIRHFWLATLPAGWYLLDGQSVNETSGVGVWALSIGQTSNGDGTVDLPDLSDRVLMQVSNTVSLGDFGGESSHILIDAELPPGVPIHGGYVPVPWGTGYNVESPGSFGSGLSHNNLQPYCGVKIAVYGG